MDWYQKHEEMDWKWQRHLDSEAVSFAGDVAHSAGAGGREDVVGEGSAALEFDDDGTVCD